MVTRGYTRERSQQSKELKYLQAQRAQGIHLHMSMSSYTKRNSTSNTPARSTAKKSRRRRTILHEEYDELSLKRMGADNGTSSIVVGQSEHAGRELTKSSMRDLEGVEATRVS